MEIQWMLDRIDALAKLHGLSRGKLLQVCGEKRYMFNLQRGRMPTISAVINVAEFYNVSVDYLLCRTQNPEINKKPLKPEHPCRGLKL